jgi:hypothetical protein
MKQFPIIFGSLILSLLSLSLSSCSDDMPEDRSEYDILGIWLDSEGHYLDLGDTEYITDYQLDEMGGQRFWLKRRLTYFYEPYSYLMLTADAEAQMHLYRLISCNDEEMVLCWLADPTMEEIEGENRYEFFKIFFEEDYVIDPANYKYWARVTPEALEEALGDDPIIEI